MYGGKIINLLCRLVRWSSSGLSLSGLSVIAQLPYGCPQRQTVKKATQSVYKNKYKKEEEQIF